MAQIPLSNVSCTFIWRELIFNDFILFLTHSKLVDGKERDLAVDQSEHGAQFTISLLRMIPVPLVVWDNRLNTTEPDELLKYFRRRKSRATVAYLDDFDENGLRSQIAAWKENVYWSSRAHIFVIVSKTSNGHQAAQKIAEEFWAKTLAAKLTILTDSNGEIEFFTWTPYEPSCTVQVFLLTSGEAYVTNTTMKITPTKDWTNLNKCELGAAVTSLEPFVFDRNATGHYTKGFELEIFRYLSKYMNFTYRFVEVEEGVSPWIAFKNGEPVGLLKKIYDHEADVLFHGMRVTYDRYQVTETTDSHYHDNFIWAAPLPEKVPTWRGLYLVFDELTWLLTLLVIPATAWVLSKLDKPNGALLTSFALNINASIPAMSKNLCLRGFLLFYFVYAINFSAAYQSGLFELLSQGILMHPPETATALAHLGFIIKVYPSALGNFKANAPALFDYVTEHKQGVYDENYVYNLRRIAYQNHEITLHTELTVRYQIQLRFSSIEKKPYIRILDERFAPYWPVFYMTLGHPLTPTMQIIMRRLWEHGWTLHFVQDAMYEASTNKELSESADLDATLSYFEDTVHSLNLNHLYGAFFIFVSLAILSTLAFAFEILGNRFCLKHLKPLEWIRGIFSKRDAIKSRRKSTVPLCGSFGDKTVRDRFSYCP